MFISFALGPAPRGTQSYASDLARRLRERDFTVFFSEEEATPGQPLTRSLRDALHRSRVLVVVSNRGTLADPPWVRTEVEEFRERHPGRPVVPISVGGALQDASLGADARSWLAHEGKIWIDESDDAVEKGIASESVVARLALVPNHVRSNVRWRWALGAVVAGLALLTATSIGAAYYAARQRDAAVSNLAQSHLEAAERALVDLDVLAAETAFVQALNARDELATRERLLEVRARGLNLRWEVAGTGNILVAALSPNGGRVALARANEVDLHDVSTGERLMGFPIEGRPTALAFDPRRAALTRWRGARLGPD
jgi:hypothetical protein